MARLVAVANGGKPTPQWPDVTKPDVRGPKPKQPKSAA